MDTKEFINFIIKKNNGGFVRACKNNDGDLNDFDSCVSNMSTFASLADGFKNDSNAELSRVLVMIGKTRVMVFLI